MYFTICILPLNKTAYKKSQQCFHETITLKIYLSAKCQHGQDTWKNSKKLDLSNIKTFYEVMLIKMM